MVGVLYAYIKAQPDLDHFWGQKRRLLVFLLFRASWNWAGYENAFLILDSILIAQSYPAPVPSPMFGGWRTACPWHGLKIHSKDKVIAKHLN